jgi:hypothetical protein
MSEELRLAIAKHSKRIGANPMDFATVISYETGGTFDPWQKGPTTKWGRHIGFIQMGEPQRKQYGYTPGKSIDELVGASADYLKREGFKPGMGLLDMYSTINAGAPGLYHRSDTAAGGAPGTVADKVRYQMHGHRQKAVKLMAGHNLPATMSLPPPSPDRYVTANLDAKKQWEEYRQTGQDNSGYSFSGPQMMERNDGTYASIPQGQQAPDLSYSEIQAPDFDSDEEAYVRGQNDASIMGMDPNGVSYSDTWKTAFERSWFIPNLNNTIETYNFQAQEGYELEKDLPRVTQGVPEQYWDQFQIAGSPQQADFIRDQIMTQMKQDAIIAANPKMGLAATIVAETLDPATLVAAFGGEALAPFILATKAARVGRTIRGAVGAGMGNLAAEATLDAVDPRERGVSDYAIALGAGMLVGGALGYFARGNSPVDRAINEELVRLGTEATQGRRALDNGRGSAGAASNTQSSVAENVLPSDAAFDFEDMIGAETAGTGRQIGNVAAKPFGRIADPVTKSEDIGGEAFAFTRQIIPDPRGARNGETVDTTVVDRFNQSYNSVRYEWESTAFPQYEKWAKRNLSGWSRAKNRLRIDDKEVNDFFRLVNEYVEETDPIKKAAFETEVKTVGDKAVKLMNRFREEGVRAGIKGMPEEARPNYMPYYRDDQSWLEINEKFAFDDIKSAISNELKRKLPNASDELVTTISEGYLKNISRASLNIQDPFQKAVSSLDKDQLLAFLRDELGVRDEKIVDEFMQLNVFRKDQGSAATPRVQSRALDLEGYQTKTFLKYKDDYRGPRDNRGGEEFSVRDFFVKDAHAQIMRYNRDMSGTLAFARMQFYNPRTQELLIDGIRDDADWAKAKDTIASAVLAKNPDKSVKVEDLMKDLDYVYNEIKKGGGDNPRMSKIGRRLGIMSFVNFMQNMGLNQAQEFVNIVSGTSLRTTIRAIPAYKRMLDDAGQSVPTNVVMRELQTLLGRGNNVLIGSRRYHLSEAQLGTEANSSAIGRGFDTVLSKAQAVVTKISGMEYVDNSLQNWAMLNAAQYFADLAAKYGKKIDQGNFKMEDINGLFTRADAKRLRSLGLDDRKLVRVLNSFRKHSGVTDKATRLRELNLDKWDADTLSSFRTALDRWSARAIQQNEIGTLSRYMSHPIAKIMLQFRSFVFGAYNKQTMYGLNHMDIRQFAQWTLQLMAGAGTWYLYLKTLSLGERDPDAYMKKRLGETGSWDYYKNLGMAGLNRSGFTSIFPMIYDTGAAMTGAPRLEGRASDQVSALWGAPIFSYFDNMSKGIQAVKSAATENREISRQEVKAIVRTLFGNWLPLMSLTGALTQDRPERAPRNN